MMPKKWKEEPDWRTLNRCKSTWLGRGEFEIIYAILIETTDGYSMVLQGSHGLVIEPLPQLENE